MQINVISTCVSTKGAPLIYSSRWPMWEFNTKIYNQQKIFKIRYKYQQLTPTTTCPYPPKPYPTHSHVTGGPAISSAPLGPTSSPPRRSCGLNFALQVVDADVLQVNQMLQTAYFGLQYLKHNTSSVCNTICQAMYFISDIYDWRTIPVHQHTCLACVFCTWIAAAMIFG